MGWFDDYAARYPHGNRYRANSRTVYCITEGPGHPVKIGVTGNIKSRFINIQAQTWRPVYLCWTAAGSANHERAVKHIFRGDVYHGEWFKDPNDVIKTCFEGDVSEGVFVGLIERLAAERGIPSAAYPPEPRRPGLPIMAFPRPLRMAS